MGSSGIVIGGDERGGRERERGVRFCLCERTSEVWDNQVEVPCRSHCVHRIAGNPKTLHPRVRAFGDPFHSWRIIV